MYVNCDKFGSLCGYYNIHQDFRGDQICCWSADIVQMILPYVVLCPTGSTTAPAKIPTGEYNFNLYASVTM
eukprot:12121495-Ditylum_brightwellii.AAC.1